MWRPLEIFLNEWVPAHSPLPEPEMKAGGFDLDLLLRLVRPGFLAEDYRACLESIKSSCLFAAVNSICGAMNRVLGTDNGYVHLMASVATLDHGVVSSGYNSNT